METHRFQDVQYSQDDLKIGQHMHKCKRSSSVGGLAGQAGPSPLGSTVLTWCPGCCAPQPSPGAWSLAYRIVPGRPSAVNRSLVHWEEPGLGSSVLESYIHYPLTVGSGAR